MFYSQEMNLITRLSQAGVVQCRTRNNVSIFECLLYSFETSWTKLDTVYKIQKALKQMEQASLTLQCSLYVHSDFPPQFVSSLKSE